MSRIWRIEKETRHFVGDLVVMGELCPCDGFKSVRAVAMKNKMGGFDDIHPVLIHASNLVEIKEI